MVHGECIQTYVPYLFLVIPLGPVTLTGQVTSLLILRGPVTLAGQVTSLLILCGLVTLTGQVTSLLILYGPVTLRRTGQAYYLSFLWDLSPAHDRSGLLLVIP